MPIKPNTIRTEFGKKLYAVLRTTGRTDLPALADLLKCDVSTVRRWFTDTEVERMNPDLLYRLSRVLNVPMEIWFTGQRVEADQALSAREAQLVEFVRRLGPQKRQWLAELCDAIVGNEVCPRCGKKHKHHLCMSKKH